MSVGSSLFKVPCLLLWLCGWVRSRPLPAFVPTKPPSKLVLDKVVYPIMQRQTWKAPLRMVNNSIRNRDGSDGYPSPSTSSWLSDGSNSMRGDDNDDDDDEAGNVHIPSTGVSISDEMEAAQRDRFVTKIVAIEDELLPPGTRVAQLVTTSLNSGSLEPVRYLVPLSPTPGQSINHERASETATNFILVDVPPYSPQLVAQIQSFLGTAGRLRAMVLTSRDAIHYDTSSSGDAYAIRRSDIPYWKQSFPDLQVISYRLDTPRDCRDSVAQVLDGYGPFALDESAIERPASGPSSSIFIETGRPLTVEEWDFSTAQDVMSGKQPPPDDSTDAAVDPDEDYSPQAIRTREEGKALLAIYTPGHSFGSVSYVFPHVGVCCSGFTIPVEDARTGSEDNLFGRGGYTTTGPILDCRGYVTTSRAGIARQMESARKIVREYCDSFQVVLPSRGAPLFLQGGTDERQQTLLDVIQQYEMIGKIYEELGVTSKDDLDL